MLGNDDWVNMAMTDDNVVAELLLRLKHAHALAPIKYTVEGNRLPPPNWGVRQPRTRLAFRYDVASPEKGGDSRRNSPTTPLSWGGGTTSSSGTVDGSDDSDIRGYSFSRSKQGNDSRYPSTNAFNKPRRKKSFDRLTEEETLLLSGKEDELRSFKDPRDRNKKLNRIKRMKLGSPAEIHKSTSASAVGLCSLTLPQHHGEALEVTNQKQPERTGFVLPDLNEPYSEI